MWINEIVNLLLFWVVENWDYSQEISEGKIKKYGSRLEIYVWNRYLDEYGIAATSEAID